MKRPPPVSGNTPRKGTALAVLLLLLTLLAAPFLPAQSTTHQPSCCMDAQHCSLHMHRAAAQGESLPHLASVSPPCPCTPMAPGASTTHGVPMLASAMRAEALRSESARQVQAAHLQLELQGLSAAPRGPPQSLANVFFAA